MFTQKSKLRLAAICAVILLLGLWGCQCRQAERRGMSWMTAPSRPRSKPSFSRRLFSGFAISVETFEGEVTLTGSVDSLQDKERATQLAESVYGVKNVNNLLKIK